MLKLLKHANTRPIILLQTCKHATNHLIANMHVQRYQHANTRPMRPLQTCKHANMRRYQGSRRYQRYQRSRRHNTQTGKRNYPPHPPTHAMACVITRDGPQVHAVQPRMPARTISDARADSHTHARASEMHAERIPTRSDSIRMQSRNAHDAHGISSQTHPRASPLHAEANPTPNQNGQCNEAPLPTQ